MKIQTLILSLFVLTLLGACSSETVHREKEVPKTSEAAKTKGTDCTYSVAAKSVQVNWTAFKKTEKVAVKGTFDKVTVNTKSAVSSVAQLMAGAKFDISTNSVNSNKPERDKKLVEFFFGKFVQTDISGQFKTITGDGKNGKGMVEISMNGISKNTPFSYTVSGDNIEVTTSINTDLWNGMNAIAALNKVCKDLHTGKDGISKTWKDVDVKVIIPLVVNCK